MNANQIALHTSGDCFHSQEYGGTGTLGQANCTDLAGCTVRQTDTRSYGASFQQAGGGTLMAPVCHNFFTNRLQKQGFGPSSLTLRAC